MSERYASVNTHTQTQIKIEGSRFITDVFPVENETEAKKHLEEVRKKYFDATHHCYAFTFGESRSFVRYSDDGEPAGTAGVKIFSAIQTNDISDVLIIVTRYFGGTKLGVGGLGRAYFDSANTAIKNSEIIFKAVLQQLEVTFPFDETNPVMNFITTRKYKIQRTDYASDSCSLLVLIPPTQLNDVKTLITNTTRGKAKLICKEIQTIKL